MPTLRKKRDTNFINLWALALVIADAGAAIRGAIALQRLKSAAGRDRAAVPVRR
jgi:hypothetical protein